MTGQKITVTVYMRSYFFSVLEDACRRTHIKYSTMIRNAVEYALQNKVNLRKYINTEQWVNGGTYANRVVSKIDKDTLRQFDEYIVSQGISDRSLGIRCALIAYLKIGDDEKTYKARVEKITF
jgi:hypothetical protein